MKRAGGRMSTTIRDIAEKSGYSVATVSRVLNQKGYVSREAKERIRAVIKELEYIPNALARDLSAGHNRKIGVVLPHITSPFFTELLNGIIEAAFASQYQVVILPSEYDERKEIEYLENLRSKAFSALIFTSHQVPLGVLNQYTPYGVVVCCEKAPNTNLLSVVFERETAYREAFSWIYQKKLRNLYFLLSRERNLSITSQTIAKAYEYVYQKPLLEEQQFIGVRQYEDGYAVAEKVIASGLVVDCFFANGDDIAAAIYQCYQDHQKPVPFLVGQENQRSSQLLGISTIDHHFNQMGRSAFALATGEIQQKEIAYTSDFIKRERATWI